MSNLKKSLLPVKVFAKVAIRRAFRDKTSLFFIFAFPLIFLFVFGGIFGKGGDTSFKVAVINQSDSQYAKQLTEQIGKAQIYKVSDDVTTLDGAKEKMTRGQLDATIILPPTFGQQQGELPSGQAVVYYTQNNLQASQALTSILQAQFQGLNSQFVKAPVPFTVKAEQINEQALSQFDYVFAGLLGFSIIGIGIFGPVNVFPELKKQGVLRRLHTTPLRVWQYFLANVVSQSVVGMMTMALMFIVAIVVFDLNVVGNYLALAFFLVFSIAMILGIGLALGGWAKNEQQAAPLSNIVVFPMLFLSGTFFPRFLMPEWLQTVSSFLPLTPVIEGIRLIATEGKTLLELGPQLGLMAAWTLVIYFIAFRIFRWE
ncbi:MAG: type transport system permease protein [Patescibacteria group bacterium]|nr:type transport system permease protein [Patescibacteria group bacterium]